MLVKITDSHAVGPFHFSGVRLQLAGDDAEKGGFPLAVRTDQTYVFTLEQAKGGVFQNPASAKPVRDVFYI